MARIKAEPEVTNAQPPHEDNKHDDISEKAGLTVNRDSDDHAVEQGPKPIEKKQLIVKLQLPHKQDGTFLSLDEGADTLSDKNTPQKGSLNDGCKSPEVDLSSSNVCEGTVTPQMLHITPTQVAGGKTPQAPNETSQHVGDRKSIPDDSLVKQGDDSGPPVLIKQEPMEDNHQEKLQNPDTGDSHANQKEHITQGNGDARPTSQSSHPTVVQIQEDERQGKEQADEPHGQPEREQQVLKGKSVEDHMSTSLEELMGQLGDSKSFLDAMNEDKFGGATPQQDFAKNDNQQDYSKVRMSKHERPCDEERILFSEDDESPEELNSEGLENQDIEDNDEGEPREVDEKPLRGRMLNRAKSQALESARSESYLWEERLKQLKDNVKRAKAAQLSTRSSQPNVLLSGRHGGDQRQGFTRPGSHQLPGTQHPHHFTMATSSSSPNPAALRQQCQQAEQKFPPVKQREHRGPPDFPRLSHFPGIDDQMAVINYPGSLQGGHPYGVQSQQGMGFPYPGYSYAPYDPMPLNHPSAPYPLQAYDFSERSSMSFGANQQGSRGQDIPAYETDENETIDGQEEQQSDDDSNDDEPLKERVKRHPSITGHPLGIDNSHPSSTSEKKPIASQVQNLVRKQRPLPQPIDLGSPSSSPSSGSGIGSWKLPVYEVQRQPKEEEEDGPMAKVSIPNLVREELLLSPDHADQEVHLLLNIFIPAQQALATPESEPAVAVLNFHTIAIMIVEAFVQFEIGDEFGQGRGHWHNDYDQSNKEFKRFRDARDASVDEIFFAVIDRWRAGLESKKQNLELIRGVQEFCDIALDVIYYIKEHGLLSAEPEPKCRAERSDKGKKRGPRKAQEEEDEVEEEVGNGKGKKRAAAQEPNEVQARKKAKTGKAASTPKGKSKAKVTPKSKPRARSGITKRVTVIVRK